MNEIDLKVTCQAAPTQIEGIAYGKYVYFRERGGHWGFGMGDDLDEAVAQAMEETLASGTCQEFMTTEDAMELTLVLIKTCTRDKSWYGLDDHG